MTLSSVLTKRSAASPTSSPNSSSRASRRTGIHWATGVPRGKVPLIKDWPNAASTDADTICDWFDRWPCCNYGIATRGLCVVDVDIARDQPFGLGEAAADAARTWRFQPALEDGAPVPSTLLFPVDFEL